ncbi:c-Myc-binding protein [Armigeres subalbatus]|uniref:c-Myc-binding protein n=1 Tax=Armigeres subalbatus TaxID=124917 RepID=UPI002ED17EA6
MSSFKPIDGSKEDFRKYLDRKGVLDAITKVLIKCNSDRPENAIEYLLDNLGERLKDKDTIARLECELNDTRNEVEVLKREINALKLNVVESGNSQLGPQPGETAQDNLDITGSSSALDLENPSTKTESVDGTISDTAVAKVPEDAVSDPKESVQ